MLHIVDKISKFIYDVLEKWTFEAGTIYDDVIHSDASYLWSNKELRITV